MPKDAPPPSEDIYRNLDIPHHDKPERHRIEAVWGIPNTMPEGVTDLGQSPIPARADHKHESSGGGVAPVLKFFHPGALTPTKSPADWFDDQYMELYEARIWIETAVTGILAVKVMKNATTVTTINVPSGTNRVETSITPNTYVPWLDGGTNAFERAYIDLTGMTATGGKDLSVHLLFRPVAAP